MKISYVISNENCSAAMLNKLPKKMGDPGSLTLPCQVGKLATIHVIFDSKASVKLRPYSFYMELNHLDPIPICTTIHLANKMVIFLRGLCEDLLGKIDKFVFSADFVVLDMEEDNQSPIILGRTFLSTT